MPVWGGDASLYGLDFLLWQGYIIIMEKEGGKIPVSPSIAKFRHLVGTSSIFDLTPQLLQGGHLLNVGLTRTAPTIL